MTVHHDMDRIRGLMLAIARRPAHTEVIGSDLLGDDQDDAMVADDLWLLIAADYLQGRSATTLVGVRSAQVVITSITWQGRQLIDAIDNASAWEGTRQYAAQRGNKLSVGVLAEIATAISLQTILS